MGGGEVITWWLTRFDTCIDGCRTLQELSEQILLAKCSSGACYNMVLGVG